MNNIAKKILALMLSIITVFALFACSAKTAEGTTGKPEEPTEKAEAPVEEPAEEPEAPVEEPTEEPEEVDPTVKMSVKTFEKKAEELGMTVPIFNNVIQAGVIDSAIVLKTQDNLTLWQAEYYILYNEESAKAVFEDNVGDPNAKTTIKADGTVSFEKTEDGKYLYIAYFGRSFFYINAEDKYASSIKSFVDAIGF